jgi:hypothetical protein
MKIQLLSLQLNAIVKNLLTIHMLKGIKKPVLT